MQPGWLLKGCRFERIARKLGRDISYNARLLEPTRVPNSCASILFSFLSRSNSSPRELISILPSRLLRKPSPRVRGPIALLVPPQMHENEPKLGAGAADIQDVGKSPDGVVIGLEPDLVPVAGRGADYFPAGAEGVAEDVLLGARFVGPAVDPPFVVGHAGFHKGPFVADFELEVVV